MIKKIITVLSLFIMFTQNSISQELIIKDFKHLDGNPSARINKEKDVNGQYCSILIIKHNLGDFEVETGKGYERIEKKKGETWVWVSPDEYQIVIRKDSYLPTPYNLRNKLNKLETYELTVTNEYGIIRVDAPDAKIWLDDKPAGNNYYVFNNLKEGKYIVKATREKYNTEEKFIILNAGDDTLLHFNLKPKLGNLIVNFSNNETLGANVFINNSLKGKTNITVPLIIGRHSLRLEKEGYLPLKQNVLIEENKNTLVNAQMEVDPSILVKKYKRNRNIWLGSTIACSGIGVYSLLKSNQLYDEYQTATTNASDLHDKIETYDIITPVTFAAAGLCLVEFFIQNSKYKKAKSKLKLYPSYSYNSYSLSINFSF